MKPKEVVLKALDGGKPDRPPVALMGGGMWGACHYNTTLENLLHSDDDMADFLVKMAGDTRSDIVYAGSGFPNLPAAALGCKILFRDVGAVDLKGPIVSSEADLEKLVSSSVTIDAYINTIQKAFRKAKARIGDDYLVTVTAWGPFTLGARLVGEETFVKGIYKNPGLVKKTVDFVADLLIRLFEPLVVGERAVEVITIGDPTASGDMISRKQFETVALPPLKKFIEWANSKNVKTILHICGDTTDRLDLFPESGASCVTLDHKTDIAKAKQALYGKMCFAGNIDPVETLLRGSPEDVEAASLKVLETAGGDGGFILMPGCDIPPMVPLENIQRMIQTAREWRR